MDKILLSPKEAADYLNVTVSKVRKDIHQGAIETVRIGRCVRIRKEFLDELIRKNTRSQIE